MLAQLPLLLGFAGFFAINLYLWSLPSLQRKFAFWKLKPVEAALEDIVSVTVDKAVDRTSGVEMYSTMLVTRAGAGWALSANDKDQAEKNASAIRSFVELQS
jgi:hypothetical protein